MGWSRQQIAARAAQEVAPRSVVNLGIGIPTLIANLLPEETEVLIHSENGLLMGRSLLRKRSTRSLSTRVSRRSRWSPAGPRSTRP